MILTCPECDTRFVVPSTIFMRGGRKLRCSSCKHQWFQEEPLEKKTDADTISDQQNALNNDNETSYIEKIKNDFRQGYSVIGGVCSIVVIIFIAYKVMMPSLIIGQGLAFDNITIERDGTALKINGNIVNAMDADRGVPSVKITRILGDDIEGDATIISPDKNMLSSGEILPISATLDDVEKEVLNIKLSFNLVQDKIEEKNSENHQEH